jgi:hypothetical protein
MKSCLFTEIQSAAKIKPAGYLEDVLANSERKGDYLVFTDEVYASLHAKYKSAARPWALDQRLVKLCQERLKICRDCNHSSENGFRCTLFKGGCCFGRWRANLGNQCPANPPKWLATTLEKRCAILEKPLHE